MFSEIIAAADAPPVIKCPLFSCKVRAGFPSPAQDHIESNIDLNLLFQADRASVFFLRVEGDSMILAGMHEGDIVVVNRSIKPLHGSIIIAVLDGELTVKRLHMRAGAVELHPANPDFPIIPIGDEQSFSIWGVVTGIVRRV